MFICPSRLHCSQFRCHSQCCFPIHLSLSELHDNLLEDAPVILIWFSRSGLKYTKCASSANAVDRSIHALCLTHSTVISAYAAPPQYYVTTTSEFYTICESFSSYYPVWKMWLRFYFSVPKQIMHFYFIAELFYTSLTECCRRLSIWVG